MTGPHYFNSLSHQPHRDRMHEAYRPDPYQTDKKLREPTKCSDCGLIYQHGRWQNPGDTIYSNPDLTRCPACARIHDKAPAGILHISGSFFSSHRDEILNLIINQEQMEREELPLERIMDIKGGIKGIAISYTGTHLTRGTGEALHHAFQGELDIEHNDWEAPIRVFWYRF